MDRPVTEQDFRLPEYRDAKIEDYEFRTDGELVRKDRWMTAIYSICSLVGLSVRKFEIPAVVAAVERLAADIEGWTAFEDDEPVDGSSVSIRTEDGSILKHAVFNKRASRWVWRTHAFPVAGVEWREERPLPAEAPHV